MNLISDNWPTTGPHTDETVTAAAEAVADLIRYLAHATRTGNALPYACDGYPALGSLGAAARSEQQVLRQFASWVTRLSEQPGLRADGRHTGSRVAREVAAELYSAAAAADLLTQALDRAQQGLGKLYHD